VAPDSTASDQSIQAQLAEDKVSQRQPFVGRERELRQLQSAFDAAASGDGRLVLLVGEPGIGKTALSDQLRRFVSAAGGSSLVGHCYEEGSFRPPYQPFVDVFGTYLHELDTDAVHAELGPSAADLARIVPALRERLQASERPPGDPEDDRWRLLRAATDLLHRAATKQPLLVVLEDLHDADRGTLDLLLYVARSLHGARILVVGTYRDVAVDRAHPLSAALTELHRASNVARIQLHGLSTDEVHRLLTETSQQTVPKPFAELVHRQTEGNPLFVHETLRFVIDTGLVERRDGTLRRVGDQSLVGRIPEGLRDAVGKRLSRLSESTNRVLRVASVIGREFQLDVLRQVLAGPEDELEAAIEESSATGIIEERSVLGTTITYQFCHAFFRQTLYDEIVASRRIRLHQQVARALEDVYARRLDEHAAELAEHYEFSSDTSDLMKAVHYGELAARRASEVFAYGEATRLVDRALIVLDLAEPDDRAKRCDLLLLVAEVLFFSGQHERVITQLAPEALVLADDLGDRSRAFRACRLALDCLFSAGGVFRVAHPEYVRWAERSIQYAAPDGIERSLADLYMARVADLRGQFAQAHALRQQALALARDQNDNWALFRTAWALATSDSAPRYWEERVRLAEECLGWPRHGVNGLTLGLTFWTCGLLHLAQGERAEAEEFWRQAEEVAERTRVSTVRLQVPRTGVILAILDGHLEDALVQLKEYVGVHVPTFGQQAGLLLLLAPALYLGRADVWLSALVEGSDSASLARTGQRAAFFIELTAARAMCLAQLGHLEAARKLVGSLLDEVAGTTGEEETPINTLTLLLQAAVVLEHRAAADVLAARLACVAHLATADRFHTSVGRQLGDAAALGGDRPVARAHYVQALESAGKIRFRPEIALTHVSLAELLLQDGDNAEKSDALEHLDLAIPELQDMKMQPGLGHALALRETVAPLAASAPGDETASHTLTAREREIASLMADGLSNHDISELLVITEGTVEVHVKHILGKLGYRSRTQVAGWVARQSPG
jgi:DNA-binding CsgD family transcriptional regulator